MEDAIFKHTSPKRKEQPSLRHCCRVRSSDPTRPLSTQQETVISLPKSVGKSNGHSGIHQWLLGMQAGDFPNLLLARLALRHLMSCRVNPQSAPFCCGSRYHRVVFSLSVNVTTSPASWSPNQKLSFCLSGMHPSCSCKKIL